MAARSTSWTVGEAESSSTTWRKISITRVLHDNKAYEFQSSLEVCRFCFMEEVDMESTHDLDKLTVDVLQRLVIRFQCIN